MHTDYVIWDPINYSLPPLTHVSACVGTVGRCYDLQHVAGVYVAYMWCVYGRIELLRILRVGAPACGAHPPLPCPAEQCTKSFHRIQKQNKQ